MLKFLDAYNAMKKAGINHMSGYDADLAIDPEYIRWEDIYKATIENVIEKQPTKHQQFIYDYIKSMTSDEEACLPDRCESNGKCSLDKCYYEEE